jgi:putative methionine-R-sulfoxide reductase with GAF domain
VSESLVHKVARDREPCLLTDLLAAEGPHAPSLTRLAAGDVQSVVVVPLLQGRRLSGVLYVDSRAVAARGESS